MRARPNLLRRTSLVRPPSRPTVRTRICRQRGWIPGDESLTPEQKADLAEADAEIARNAVVIPCPPWCRVDHAQRQQHELTEGMRECSAGSEELPMLGKGQISAEAIRITDLLSATVRPPEVRINDDTVTAEVARRLIVQLLDAVDLVDGDL